MAWGQQSCFLFCPAPRFVRGYHASCRALLFEFFFILDTTDDILDLCNHLKGTLIFERRWIGGEKEGFETVVGT